MKPSPTTSTTADVHAALAGVRTALLDFLDELPAASLLLDEPISGADLVECCNQNAPAFRRAMQRASRVGQRSWDARDGASIMLNALIASGLFSRNSVSGAELVDKIAEAYPLALEAENLQPMAIVSDAGYFTLHGEWSEDPADAICFHSVDASRVGAGNLLNVARADQPAAEWRGLASQESLVESGRAATERQ